MRIIGFHGPKVFIDVKATDLFFQWLFNYYIFCHNRTEGFNDKWKCNSEASPDKSVYICWNCPTQPSRIQISRLELFCLWRTQKSQALWLMTWSFLKAGQRAGGPVAASVPGSQAAPLQADTRFRWGMLLMVLPGWQPGHSFCQMYTLRTSREVVTWDWIAWQRQWNTAKLSFPSNDKRIRPSVLLLKFLTQLCGKHVFFVAYHLLTSEDKVISVYTNYTMWENATILSGTEWQGLNNSETSFLSLVTS